MPKGKTSTRLFIKSAKIKFFANLSQKKQPPQNYPIETATFIMSFYFYLSLFKLLINASSFEIPLSARNESIADTIGATNRMVNE